jgi:hypothetical protein
MSEKLKKIGTAISYLAVATSFHSYIMNLQDNGVKKILEEYRAEKEALGKTIVNLAENNAISESRKLNYLKNAEAEMANLQKILDNLNQGKHKTVTQLISEEKVDWSRNANESLSELHKLANDYKNSGSSSQFIDNINLIDELQKIHQSYLD